MSDIIKFHCTKVTQPIGDYYIGCLPAQDVIDISYADVRRIEQRDIEKVLGIQRPLDPSRVKLLQQYVNHIDATFPTAVILAISSDDIVSTDDQSVLEITREEKVAKIIDGQHRIAGLEGYKGSKPFNLNVVIFVDMELEDQASVFATINLAQTKVNTSLVYDLFEYSRTRSPQKTGHNICRLMDTRDDSPFYNRIQILGKPGQSKSETLTQARFVTSVVGYISQNPLEDRDLLRRGKQLTRANSKDVDRMIFRNFFIDEKDEQIMLILWNYFSAVRDRWPDAWSSTNTGAILVRSTGYGALMRFLRLSYIGLKNNHLEPSVSNFSSYFAEISINDDDLIGVNYAAGTQGVAKLYEALLKSSRFQNAQLGFEV